MAIDSIRGGLRGKRFVFGVVAGFLAAGLSGCAGMGRLPDSVVVLADPSLGRQYLLYRPAEYTRDKYWPLLVACHAGLGDSPKAQIRQWSPLADQYGFLVVAPSLTGGAAGEKRRDDERHVVSVVQHVRAGHSISDDRILIYGQGSGGYTALAAALSAPAVFRAAAFSDPRFRSQDLESMDRSPDPYQPIYIRYNATDIVVGGHIRQSVDWLRSHGADVRADTFGGNPGNNPQRIIEFFQHVIRTEPWIHVHAEVRAALPGQVRFSVQSSAALEESRWDFGDGSASTQPQPVHTYAEPGTYTVRFTAVVAKEKIVRQKVISVAHGAGPPAAAP